MKRAALLGAALVVACAPTGATVRVNAVDQVADDEPVRRRMCDGNSRPRVHLGQSTAFMVVGGTVRAMVHDAAECVDVACAVDIAEVAGRELALSATHPGYARLIDVSQAPARALLRVPLSDVGERALALSDASGSPVILSTHAVYASAGGRQWRRLPLPQPLAPMDERHFVATDSHAFLGADRGEWGGELVSVDLRSGAHRLELSGGITALARDARRDCVLAANWGRMRWRGEVARICRTSTTDTIQRIVTVDQAVLSLIPGAVLLSDAPRNLYERRSPGGVFYLDARGVLAAPTHAPERRQVCGLEFTAYDRATAVHHQGEAHALVPKGRTWP